MSAILLLICLAAPPSVLHLERDDETRARLLDKASLAAIDQGLDWLARHQADDGSWDADGFQRRCEESETPCDGIGKGQHGEEVPCPFDDPITALATLAFLAAGHLEEDALHRSVVDAALEHLSLADGTWTLPLALSVFAEVEALEGKGRFRDDVDALAAALLARRQEDGAFGYAAPYRPGSDVPYTALAVIGLLSAKDAGVPLPDDFAADIDRYLDSLEETKGQLAYLADGRRYGYTPTATNAHLAAAMRELLAVDTGSARHRAHLRLIAKQKPKWKISFRTVEVPGRGEVSVQVGHLSLYQWWYGTIASYQRGGQTWRAWSSAAKRELVANQEKRGCRRGSFPPAGTYERQTGGRVFATALGVLILAEPLRRLRVSR